MDAKFRLPSPAMAVGLLALFVALGGTGYAATQVIGQPGGSASKKSKSKHADKAQDIALIKRQAGRLRGPKGDVGLRGPQGIQGLPGSQGPQGLQGTARAYARVDPSQCSGGPPEICTLFQSRGISSITRVGIGSYCVTAPGVSSTDEPALVSVEWNRTAGPTSLGAAQYNGGNNGCAPNLFNIVTSRPSAFSTEAVTNGVAFIVMIP